MTYAELRNDEFPFGANCTPPAALVGGFVAGALHAGREVVHAEPLYAAHELDDRHDPDREAYATVYQYPRREYAGHVARVGSPKGYAGPAACCRLVWDIDRPTDPAAALDDARTLARFITGRYGEDGLAAFYSGGKGYHLSLVAVPGFHPLPHVPAVVKLLCLTVARAAGVVVDGTVYDRQRLFRLPNSRHRSGLYKRLLDLNELHRLTPAAVRDLARHPAGFPVPAVSELNPNLEADWLAAERRVLDAPGADPIRPTAGAAAPSCRPVVPLFVKEFVGFNVAQEPGRAVTLFRAAAALAEGFHAHGPDAVIRGLLEEPALKLGLDPGEVAKQLRDGIAHGSRKGGAA